MAGNPFGITPANYNVQPLLTGIGDVMKENRAKKQKQIETEEITQAMQSNNPSLVADLMIKYPDRQKEIVEGANYRKGVTDEVMIDAYRKASVDPTNGAQYMQDAVDKVLELGGKPDNLRQSVQMFTENPEQAAQLSKVAFASLDPKGFKALQGESGDKPNWITLGAGATAVNPDTGQQITAPGKKESLPWYVSRGEDGKIVYDQAYLDAKGGEDGGDKDRFKNAEKLRKEFTGITSEFKKINDSYGRIKASTDNPSPAGDLSLIFNYMKMLDPGSVVRESEFATAAASGSFGDRFVSAGERILSGKRLSPPQRKDFEDRAKKLYGQAAKTHKKRKSEYTRLSERFGIDPEDVIIERQMFSTDEAQSVNEGATATNPQTGQKVIFSNGQWQPAP